jgi:uncharacterized delta-60 repeat protein
LRSSWAPLSITLVFGGGHRRSIPFWRKAEDGGMTTPKLRSKREWAEALAMACLSVANLASVPVIADQTNICNSAALVDQTFQPPPSILCDEVSAIVRQADGKILVSADCVDNGFQSSSSLIRLNADSSLDTGFKLDPRVALLNSWVAPIVQPDGRILLYVTQVLFRNENRSGIVRLNADGSLDTSFTPGVGGDEIYAASLQPDGKVLIGGLTILVDDTVQTNIGRLNEDGSLDKSFASVFGSGGGYSSGPLYSMAQQSDGKVILGGYYLVVNGAPLPVSLLRLNADGSLDTSYSPALGSGCFQFGVNTVLMLPDDKVIIAGCFDSVNGIPRPNIARLNPDGSLDETFNASLNGHGILRLETDGRMLSSDGSSLVRLNPDGSADNTFILTVAVTNDTSDLARISTFAALPNDRVMIGGTFTMVNCVSRTGIARLVADSNVFIPAQTTLTNNHFALTITTEAKRAYAIETSADFIHWRSLGTNTADGLTLRFLDPESASAPFRFYRTRIINE